MFFRQKRSGKYTYLQIVENRWEDGRSKQRVIVTLGRLDELREQGQLDGLLRSGAKLSQAAMVLTAQQKGELPVIVTKRIGPELIFQRLWSELKIPQVLEALLAPRRFEFPIERVVFLTRFLQRGESFRRKSLRCNARSGRRAGFLVPQLVSRIHKWPAI